MEEEPLYYGLLTAFVLLLSIIPEFFFISSSEIVIGKEVKILWLVIKGLQHFWIIALIALIAHYYYNNFRYLEYIDDESTTELKEKDKKKKGFDKVTIEINDPPPPYL